MLTVHDVATAPAVGPAATDEPGREHSTDPELIRVAFTLNGTPVRAVVEARTLLVHHLREDHHLTGTHVGCDTSQCGACAVLVDGRAVKSCTMLAAQADGSDVTTIEGVGENTGLHEVQSALQRHHGVQCGFCTAGIVIAALDLMASDDRLDEAAVRHALAGNICRCTGYQGIVDAILETAAAREARGR